MFIGRGLESLSSNSVAQTETCLNISENEFRSLESLAFLPDLEEIIADNNYIDEDIKIPKLLKLHTLSLNKNKIKDLDVLLNALVDNTPHLTLLSLLGNPVLPDPIYRHLDRLSRVIEEPSGEMGGDADGDGEEEGDDDDDEYQRYRWKILYRLPMLVFLDSSKVTDTERAEARRRGQFLQKRNSDFEVKKSDDGFANNNLGSLAQNRVTEWISALSPVKTSFNDESLSPLSEPTKKKTPKVYYGKNQYVYKGRYSEGNRFIKNLDL